MNIITSRVQTWTSLIARVHICIIITKPPKKNIKNVAKTFVYIKTNKKKTCKQKIFFYSSHLVGLFSTNSVFFNKIIEQAFPERGILKLVAVKWRSRLLPFAHPLHRSRDVPFCQYMLSLLQLSLNGNS